MCLGAVRMCDVVLNDGLEEIAKQELGLPPEEPEPIPDYMPTESAPTEE